jgi:hypothetical protein
MEPIFGFAIFLAACGIVALVARKKGRSAAMFFFGSAIPALPLVLLVSAVLGNDPSKGGSMALAAFLSPLVGLVVAIMVKNKEQMAVETGDFGDYRKCPFCAESVRKEAVKCKHCGSEIQPLPPTAAPGENWRDSVV